jgi:hypothetical protein
MASSDPPSGGDREVFASLPNSRPTRRSAKRDRVPRGRGASAATDGPAKPARASAEAARKGRAKAGAKAAPKAKPRAARATAKRGAAPKASPIPPAGYATPPADDDGPRGADLVTTAVQAAGELAHIGIAAGGRALRSALQRLPRP